MGRQLRIMILSAIGAWIFGIGLICIACFIGPWLCATALMLSVFMFAAYDLYSHVEREDAEDGY